MGKKRILSKSGLGAVRGTVVLSRKVKVSFIEKKICT